MIPFSPASCRQWHLLIFIAMLAVVSVHSEPFTPKDNSQILETLRSKEMNPAEHQLHQLRQRLTVEPTNLTVACEFSRLCIERSRSDSDPRFLGRAQAALAPWWQAKSPPMDALVLRATLKQSQHDFTNALLDLELAGKMDPRNPQVWLTRATILTVIGNYQDARQACFMLARTAPGIIALTAAASVANLNGEAARASAMLRTELQRNPKNPASEKLWGLTVLAESNVRLGQTAEAESNFKAALALGIHDPYLLGAYADFLLGQNRADEVAAMLKDEKRADGLLLRLALAESRQTPRPPSFASHLQTLAALFEAGHLRGDFVHQREEAIFKLHLQNQPDEALQLSLVNWSVQREPVDLQILLESALAAHLPAAAQPALDFLRNNHLEDTHIAELAKQLNSQLTHF